MNGHSCGSHEGHMKIHKSLIKVIHAVLYSMREPGQVEFLHLYKHCMQFLREQALHAKAWATSTACKGFRNKPNRVACKGLGNKHCMQRLRKQAKESFAPAHLYKRCMQRLRKEHFQMLEPNFCNGSRVVTALFLLKHQTTAN